MCIFEHKCGTLGGMTNLVKDYLKSSVVVTTRRLLNKLIVVLHVHYKCGIELRKLCPSSCFFSCNAD